MVINAAAVVGGIAANARRRADFISDNLRIQVNLLDSVVATGVERFLFPRLEQRLPEVHPTANRWGVHAHWSPRRDNAGFAIAKLAGITHLTVIRRQYGLPTSVRRPPTFTGSS